jgi:uncharacterized protein YxeA
MKAIIIIAVILLIMIGLGWITFRDSGDATNVQFETQKMKQDTEQVIEKGKEFIDETGQRTREAVDELRDDKGQPDDAEPTTAPRSR